MNDITPTFTSGIKKGIIGHIKALSAGPLPENWALCDGSELIIQDYPALFAVIGARFGGDGIQTFALPDLVSAGCFAICYDGYLPLESIPPAGWKLASDEMEYVRLRALAFVESYAQGHDPFYRHAHGSELDPVWLERQTQVLADAYAQGHDPLHRHPHLAQVDPEWLERQVQLFQDAYAQGRDPLHRHTHVSHVDPEWLERQAQVLTDAYAQGRDPLHRHSPVSELEPEWLERQTQVLKDGHAQGKNPLHRHTPGSQVDPEWLERQAQVLKDAYERHSHPLRGHPHLSEIDPEWLERQAQVLQDAYAQDHDPHHRHPHISELEDELRRRAEEMLAAYARGEDSPTTPAPDDLRRIEGIGPKISSLLQEAGVSTFAQLAATGITDLKGILSAAGMRFANPGTWPEQAQLAADEKWDELAALQDELKGGRRDRNSAVDIGND